MEVAYLATDEIHIEAERLQLQSEGLSWPEIYVRLDSKYRENSKKGAFQCACCHSKSKLVLHENKACYFSHFDSEACAGQRNYTRYGDQTRKHEHFKHRAGMAIIMDQLKANLSLSGAIVQDGYLYKEDLKFVPDIMITWPSGEIWTFDYVTGTRSSTYQRYLTNKQSLYRGQKFKSYFLFDEGMLSKLEEHAISLSEGEKGALLFLGLDEVWKEILQDVEKRYGRKAMSPNEKVLLKNFDVNRIMYVNDEMEGLFYRLTEIKVASGSIVKQIPDMWYCIIGEPARVSLPSMFSYNRTKHVFVWEEPNIAGDELHNYVRMVEERREEEIRKEGVRKQLELEKKRKIAIQLENESRLKLEQLREEAARKTVDHNKQIDDSADLQLSSIEKEPIPTDSQLVNYYRSIMERVRQRPDLLKAAPGFEERFMDIEAGIQEYLEVGQFPYQVRTYINMMEAALGMR